MTRAAIRIDARVLENRDGGGGNWCLRLDVGRDWPSTRPGQFVMVGAGPLAKVTRHDPLLPRPMAVYRVHRGSDACSVDVLYKVVGRGTALLSEARAEDRVRLVGPLGVPFPDPPRGGRLVLVGGGTGIASLFEVARANQGPGLEILLGARRAADLMGRDDFEELTGTLRIATEDGSAGHRGLVTELLERSLAAAGEASVFACGPTAMMRRAAEIASDHGSDCHVSLENRMACGVGICLGCAVPRDDREGFDLVCRDGPVFPAAGLDWAGLP